MAKSKEPKNEFRKNKDNGHPAYIYKKEGRKYTFIGITHSSITKKTKNIKLEKNPNPQDKREAYFRPTAEKADSRRFGQKKEGWTLTKADKKKATKIVKKTKK